jgi:predicted amidohydrolase YtcJ
VLLTNGRVYTLDAADTVADTVVVRDGRVAFVGRRGDVNPAAGEPIHDLGGRAVLPGLVDAHAHLMHLARTRLTVDLAGADSEEAAAARVGAAAARLGPGAWIGGRGWDQNRWPGRAFPTKASLDQAAPRHPVALARIDGHALWVNSAALHAAGVSRHTPDPPGGRIGRNARGEPTGVLVDAAVRLVQAVQPRPPAERFEATVEDAIAECLAKGLTGLHEMGADLDALAAYRQLVERGRFPLRNYVAVRGDHPEAWARSRERGPERWGDGRVVVGALKLVADGALGSRGAALHAPYCDEPGNRGLLLLDAAELEQRTAEAAAGGFQVAVHAIGDRANTLTLDAFERALARAPRPDHRFRVEHAQVLAPADIPRFRRLGVLPSMQPVHCTSDAPWAGERLGPERLPGACAWRSLLATGVVIAGGSDFPVEDPNPFHGIHAAVTHRPREGSGPDGLAGPPDQRMTRAEAVRAFTIWAAYAARQDGELGSLEPGKQADLVVCSDDVFTCPAARIKDIVPVLTLVAGEVVYRREERGAMRAGP